MLRKLIKEAIREELAANDTTGRGNSNSGIDESKEIIRQIVREELSTVKESFPDKASLLSEIRNIVSDIVSSNNSVVESKIEYFTNLLPFATYMGDNTVLTKSYFGVQYLVSSYDSIVAPYLIRYGV